MRQVLLGRFQCTARKQVAGIALAVFIVRALIPPGYMPAMDRPLSFQVCPEGLPAGFLDFGGAHAAHHHHHDHSGGPAQSEHCVFGTACAAGPAPHIATLAQFWIETHTMALAAEHEPTRVRLVFLPYARGPPVSSSSLKNN